jgi:hypothetical protein
MISVIISKVDLCAHVSLGGQNADYLKICDCNGRRIEVGCEECGEKEDVQDLQEVALADLSPEFRNCIERSYNRQTATVN